DLFEAVALDQDDLIREDPAGFGIEQPAGADRGDGRCLRARSRCKQDQDLPRKHESTKQRLVQSCFRVFAFSWLIESLSHGQGCAVFVTRPPAWREYCLNQLIMYSCVRM